MENKETTRMAPSTTGLPPRSRIILNELRTVAGFPVKLQREEFLHILKIKFESDVHGHLESILREMEKQSQELIRPAAIYGIFIPKPPLSMWFPDADLIGLSAATIGKRLEKEVERLNASGETTRGFILDALGSAWAESVVEVIYRTLAMEAERLRCKTGRRKSPGYKPWNLDSQPHVLEILHADTIGISLTEHHMMIPRKSVTFGAPMIKSHD